MLRKDIIIKTCTPEEGAGMYLNKRATRSWTETFLDADTGETVNIERNEIVADRGAEVTDAFIADCHTAGIDTIEVCNVRRAVEEKHFYRTIPFAISVSSGDEKSVVIVRSNSIYKARELAADYAEDYDNEVFKKGYSRVFVTEAKMLPNIHFLSRTEADIKAEKEALTKDKDAPVKTPFKVKASWVDAEDFDNKRKTNTFVAWGYDIADVKSLVSAYIKHEYNTVNVENNRETLLVTAASPFKCDAFVPFNLCNEYIEDDQYKLKKDN